MAVTETTHRRIRGDEWRQAPQFAVHFIINFAQVICAIAVIIYCKKVNKQANPLY